MRLSFRIFLLSPVAGAVADTYPRRYTMIVMQTAMMLLAFPLAFLTLTNRIQVWHIFVLAILLGFVNAFDIPVRQSFVAEMVGREDLISAIALNSSMMNGARLIGPSVAGILVSLVGEGWCFLLNGVSYFAVIIGLLLITAGNSRPHENHGSQMEAMLEGFRFAHRTRPVRAAFADRRGEPHGDAVLRPDADFCRRRFEGRTQGTRLAHGRCRPGRPLALQC